MKDISRINILYKRLKNNSITGAELDELFSMLEDREGRDLVEPELMKSWEEHFDSIADTDILEQIREFKMKVTSSTTTEAGNERRVFSKKRLLLRTASIAAGLVLIATLLFALGIFDSRIEYHTDYGEREKITLPDGSVVELNANTVLTWDKSWQKKKVRTVTLDGEAYFEVIHTADSKKFIVQTDDLNVEVIGTAFNVSNRHSNTEVFLETGSVRLDLKGTMSQEFMMTPGQKVTYSRVAETLVESQEQRPETTASWKDNTLYFNNKTVEEILLEVSAIYGVRFEYSDPEIKERKLNFWVPYSDWETMKDAFELTMKLKIEQNEDVYLVRKK